MLRFIANELLKESVRYSYFNTSHVTVYLSAVNEYEGAYNDFNTSHVTVYHAPEVVPVDAPAFQYISCYGLSLH